MGLLYLYLQASEDEANAGMIDKTAD
jgi:hypothetical protein